MENFRFFTGFSQENDAPSRPSSRFVSFTDEQLKEMTIKRLSKNTDSSTKVSISLLQKFCKATGVDFAAETSNEQKLNFLLMKFYAGARTEKGECYKNNSLIAFRNGIQRYFMDENKINIFENAHFKNSNVVFNNILKEGKKTGKGVTEHYPEIEPEDLSKLNSSFDSSTPTGLLEQVWFNIMFRLIRRGRENLRNMTKSTFSVGEDASGKKFIYQSQGELDKNHGVNDNSFETTGEGRIYETESSSCPVKMFLFYLNHLHPEQNALWQRPRENVKSSDSIWFCNVPLGEKYLGRMMAKLSLKYNLSQRYTNHSLRVTGLQVLEDNCVESRHIIRISGHKNTDSINNYARRLSAARKRSISNMFDNSLSTDQDENAEASCLKRQNIGQTSDRDIQVVPEVPVQNASDDDLSSLPENLFSVKPPNISFSNLQPVSSYPDNSFSTNMSNVVQHMSPRTNFSPFKPVINNCDNCNITFNITYKN